MFLDRSRDVHHCGIPAARRYWQAAEDPPAGPLRIAVSLGIAESVFTPALDALRTAYPETTLHLSTGRTPELRKLVAEALVDAAIVMTPPDRPVDEPHVELLGSERVMVVAGTTLPAPTRCRLADLGQYSWVINPDGCGFRTQLDRALVLAGHSLEVAAESWGTALQLALVARCAGLGLVAQRMIQESPHAAPLRIIDRLRQAGR